MLELQCGCFPPPALSGSGSAGRGQGVLLSAWHSQAPRKANIFVTTQAIGRSPEFEMSFTTTAGQLLFFRYYKLKYRLVGGKSQSYFPGVAVGGTGVAVGVGGTWVGSGSKVGAGVRVTPNNLSNSLS